MDTQPSTPGLYGGFEVYPMPAYTSLPASDVAATVRFFTEVVGFGLMYRGPEVGGQPMISHLRGRRYQDVLVMPARGPVHPANGLVVAFLADDLDGLAARARAAGTPCDGPTVQPWGATEVHLRDPDGNAFVFFTAPQPPAPGTDFEATMAAVADRLSRPQG